jgi:hydrogenase nickel incorporation protein HypA/HybF
MQYIAFRCVFEEDLKPGCWIYFSGSMQNSSGQRGESAHMHEFSIAEAIFNTITPMVADPGKVTAVHVTVGPLAGISAESLEFCFTEVGCERGFNEARLEVRKTGAILRCSCGREYEVQRFDELCPACGGLERIVLTGKEFTIDYLETKD